MLNQPDKARVISVMITKDIRHTLLEPRAKRSSMKKCSSKREGGSTTTMAGDIGVMDNKAGSSQIYFIIKGCLLKQGLREFINTEEERDPFMQENKLPIFFMRRGNKLKIIFKS